jgi:hypothetical protein
MLPWPMPCVFARRIFSFNNWSDFGVASGCVKDAGKGKSGMVLTWPAVYVII